MIVVVVAVAFGGDAVGQPAPGCPAGSDYVSLPDIGVSACVIDCPGMDFDFVVRDFDEDGYTDYDASCELPPAEPPFEAVSGTPSYTG